tara:strand:+ start:229 stop:462 length:234 start_codon:yes stop_codon:yes gene_type:complete
MDENTFKPGDHVVRRSHIHDEGIVLARASSIEEKYFVIFAQRTEYNAYPNLETLNVGEISLIRSEIHKEPPPPKFKK